MPWCWNVGKQEPIATGGRLGTREEAGETASWTDYDAAYLKKRLGNPTEERPAKGRFDVSGLGEVQKHIYLDKVSKNYEQEAEACLKESSCTGSRVSTRTTSTRRNI